MKLNNKGYAITIIVFGILIVFIIVLSSLLVTMNNSVKLNKVVKEEVIENIQLGADTTGMSLTERIEQLESNYNELLKTSTENYNKLLDRIITTKQQTIDEIYPVGSIYISTTDDSIDDVVTRFGGEWEKYSQGRTLVGEGTGTDTNGNVSTFEVNNIGGEYSHTLTIDEMPSHSHNAVSTDGQVNSGLSLFPFSMIAQNYNKTDSNVIRPTGGSQSHNNIQPYITVYMYKRIK